MRAALPDIFRVLVGILVPLASFTTGLRAPRRGERPIWREPSLFARSLLDILVLVPLWTVFVIWILRLPAATAAGLLVAVIAVGIGPISSVKRMDPASPEARCALELNVSVLVLSMAFVPMAFSALAALYGRRVGIAPFEVAKVVLSRALLPLLIGLAAARLFPRMAGRPGQLLAKTTRAVFVLVVLVALAATWRQLLAVGPLAWVACLVVAAGAVTAGHFLGGPRPATRSILAAASTMRFPALALLLASVSAQPARLTPVVLAYVICAFLLVSLYELTIRRHGRRDAGSAPTSGLFPSPQVR